MKKLFSFVLSLIVLAGFVWSAFNYQLIVDQYIAATYKPSAEIVSLADDIGLTDKGNFLLRAAQAELNTREDFNKNCHKKDSDSVILGCYEGPQHLYIYNVVDSRLDGVRQVTTAHEVLHAAYDRLSSSERQRVNNLIEAALPEASKTTTDLGKRLQIYEKTEPGERDNELHSILGTEATNLPAELEDYYKQYFKDRRLVTDFSEHYTKIFNDIKNSQASLLTEREQLNQQIAVLKSQYDAERTVLSGDIDDFNRRAKQGGFSSQADFESVRASLLFRQDQLESDRRLINQKVEEYNQKGEQLKLLNVQVEDLNTELDSTKLPSL